MPRKNKLPAPIADTGRQIQQDKKAAAAGAEAVEPLDRWKTTQNSLLIKLQAATEADDAMRAKSYAVAAGIATEKVLLLENKPTAIIGGLEQNRHMLPELLSRLAAAAEIVRRQNG